MKRINLRSTLIFAIWCVSFNTGFDFNSVRDVGTNVGFPDATVKEKSTGTKHHAPMDTAVVHFQTGSSSLTGVEKDRLHQLVDSLNPNQDLVIDRVEIATWSDQFFSNSDLSTANKNLAEKRALQIESFIKENKKISNFEVFNMAEKANWLAHVFNTPDAELKSQFAKRVAPPLSDDELRFIKENGAPGVAVVVVKWRERRPMDLEQKELEGPIAK